ncbi:hypothetical protein F4782DRAFT_547477 [Xylaria castorea]|nr:hypothetical protein F4782DRAFT_547477 [Xylaria castorea]
MSQHKRKTSPHSDDRNPRKLQRSESRGWIGIEDFSNGTVETVKHLVTRLHGKITPNNEEIWVSSAKARALSKRQQYYDLPTVKATGPLFILSNRPRPPFVGKERWLREIGPGLITALLKYKAADRLKSGELNAMLCMILGGQSPHIKFETSFARVFGHHPNDTFDSSTIRSIGHLKAKFFFFGGNRLTGNVNASVTWYLMVIDVTERTIYFVDPASSSRGLSEQQRDTFLHLRRLWKQCIYPTDPDIRAPRKAVSLPLAQLNEELSSGFACIINAYLLVRRPRELWNFIKSESTSFEVSQSCTETLMKSFEDCLQLKVHPQWQQPSSTPNKNHHLVRLPQIPFDGLLVALAVSVKRGNWDDLTKLVKSVFGRLPIPSDNFPVPSQTTSPNIIPANTAYYIPWTSRAVALLSGKTPPDLSDRKLWNNVIGPRIANVLICMAKRRRLSGLEISAYLHMVLVDFFIDGHRTPKVMIETSFGDFLMRGVPRDVEWCNSVMKNKPRFLIFSRGQDIVGHHWYIIVVDTNARQAYCFDSMAAQDTRAEHIEAFALLQKEWATRMPSTPAPEQMIELSSFSQKDYLNSGFLCMYHILLLFRAPMLLKRLKHGDVVATRLDLDGIIQLAENYIGIKIKGSTEEIAPVSNLTSNSNDCNDDIPEKEPFRIEVHKSQHNSKAEKHQPRKHTQKESSAPHKPIQENRGSWFNSFTAREIDTSGPGFSEPGESQPASTPVMPRSTKRSHHKAAPAQYKIKTYQPGSTYEDILDMKFDIAPVGSAERLHQYRTGAITTPFIRPGETLEEYSQRPIPNHPNNWQGWDWYNANVAAVDAANREEPPDKKAARVKLQQKRGKGGDLMELDMDTMKPKQQSKGKN